MPVIEEACDAGITVVVLDAEMDAQCATVVRNAYDEWGADSLQPALEAIGGKGNIVINRGVVGSQPEEAFHDRQQEILADYPDVKVVAEVNGFCDSATTQKEIVGRPRLAARDRRCSRLHRRHGRRPGLRVGRPRSARRRLRHRRQDR